MRVLCGDPIPERYEYMFSDLPQPDFTPQFICALDVADAKLLGPAVQAQYGDRVDLCIDHHSTNTGYAAHTCVDSSCAAAAMILFRIIGLLGVGLTPGHRPVSLHRHCHRYRLLQIFQCGCAGASDGCRLH